ncbi:unnamed protein product [Blepharisma stoltei]|uniref:Uncharacterized protein n=1 Tax=Blepharisma stoltei TaxID=1481888 RepID=A0AAU9K305_9CILI|nr:unnamed protein product [Blepharisma stoltei]
MGNVIIPQSYQDTWREEYKRADQLLRMTPYNEQEKDLIYKTRKDQYYKEWGFCLLGVALGFSLKRYFPAAQVIDSAPLFSLTMAAIIMPLYIYARIMTNRDVIESLEMIEENHEILEFR